MKFLLYIEEPFRLGYISLDSFQLETRPKFRKCFRWMCPVSHSKGMESLSSFLGFGACKEVGGQGIQHLISSVE